MHEVLDAASERITAELAGEPALETAVRRAIGKTYHGLGLHDAAEEQLRAALDTARSTYSEDHPDLASAMHEYGHLMTTLRRFPDAVEWLEVPSLGGEDFAHYQELIPGAIVRLGAALADPRARYPLHSSHFDVNEDALAVGADVLGWSALRLAASYAGQRA